MIPRVFISKGEKSMNIQEKKHIVQKLLSGTLSDEEKAWLTQSPEMEQIWLQQWEHASDRSQEVNPEQLWASIQQQTGQKNRSWKSYFYKWYSAVASILLVVALSGIAYLWNQRTTAPIYVVASGIQNLEKIQLPDGTDVCLGPGSRLEYPSEFRNDSRNVRLEGQAFFDVAKDPSKPFRVQMDDIQVEALGTAFELFNYKDSEKMEAILVNGKIKVGFEQDNKVVEEQVMSPNERLIWHKKNNQVEIGKINADKYTSWRNGVLSFENENLAMIIPRLERWYGRKIRCEESLLNNYRFTFKVRDESLDVILFIMRQSAPLQYKKNTDDSYILTRKK